MGAAHEAAPPPRRSETDVPGTNLTRDEAASRASLVSVESYDVVLDLTTGPRTFATTSTVRFTAQPGAETFLDFVGESVEPVTLNGAPLDPAAVVADSRITLPGLAADNEVVVAATGRYTNTGEGLHRFVDPVDDEVYLYSQFEVPDSRRVFAVFEQPDLKATFAFTVTAPAHWQLVSNSPTPEPSEVVERRRRRRRAPGPSRRPRGCRPTSRRSSPARMPSCATRRRRARARCRWRSTPASR